MEDRNRWEEQGGLSPKVYRILLLIAFLIVMLSGIFWRCSDQNPTNDPDFYITTLRDIDLKSTGEHFPLVIVINTRSQMYICY